MKHLLIILFLLTLTFPLVAQEAGVLYLKTVNGKYGWFENGNDKKDWKYIGEIKNGKPNGTGILSSTYGKYFGKLKNGILHGQGTYSYKSGRKRVGEFRKGKEWNVKSYDKKGKLETEWVKGRKLGKVAQETGVLYLKTVNGKYGWFENSNDKKDWKYIGEIKNGKPNGTGVLSSTFGKYSGELKNGILHGQGTYTYKSGRKRVGEFRKGKEWNVKSYDKKGKLETEWVKGRKLGKVAQETGVLYLKTVNGKYGWFENSNDKKDWKYIGEIKNGKPNGTGVLSSTFGKYSGELKNGMKHGQGTYTYKSGRKRVGEFRKGKPWNVNNYDKNGKIEAAWIKGIKLKWVKGRKLEKKEIPPLEEKEVSENRSYKIGVRALLGNTSGKANTSNSSLSLIWENYGLGFNQMSFKKTSSKNNVYEMKDSSLDLSYTLEFTCQYVD